MKQETKSALADALLGMADDELILGHRDSEWSGHAPILEEDIAFSNIALDELGHAVVWLGLHSELVGESRETYPDQLVYYRSGADFRNIQLVELLKGDWAFTIVRQYLFDVAEALRMAHLVNSTYQPLAEVAAKIRKEEIYHLRHSRAWVRRLGLGTEESQRRMQTALDTLWPYALQMFTSWPHEAALVEAGYLPASDGIRREWDAEVIPFLTEAGLRVPDISVTKLSRSEHTEHLQALLSELQEVVHELPNVNW